MVKQFKSYLITGLLVLVPFAATAAVVWKSFVLLDGWIQHFGINIPGAGLIVLLSVLILTGMLVRHYVGKKVYQYAEWLMLKVPLVNTVYSTLREVAKTLFSSDKSAFEAVVLIEFCGQKTLGLITGDAPRAIKGATDPRDKLKLVYVMQAFSPAAGFILMVPESQMKTIDMPVEAAMKLILTGGMVKTAEATQL